MKKLAATTFTTELQ